MNLVGQTMADARVINQQVIEYINNYKGVSLYDKVALKVKIDEELKEIPEKYKES